MWVSCAWRGSCHCVVCMWSIRAVWCQGFNYEYVVVEIWKKSVYWAQIHSLLYSARTAVCNCDRVHVQKCSYNHKNRNGSLCWDQNNQCTPVCLWLFVIRFVFAFFFNPETRERQKVMIFRCSVIYLQVYARAIKTCTLFKPTHARRKPIIC